METTQTSLPISKQFPLLQQYIATILQLSKELHYANKPVEEAKKASMPAPFDTWEAAGVFAWNMEFLYERLSHP